MSHENGQVLRMETEQHQCLQSLRVDIQAGFEAVEGGDYTDYDATNIKTLARRVKALGRRRLAADSGRPSKR